MRPKKIPYFQTSLITAGNSVDRMDVSCIGYLRIVRGIEPEEYPPYIAQQKNDKTIGQGETAPYNSQRVSVANKLTESESILHRIAAGDGGAMRECIDRYGNLLWGIVRRYVKDTTEAEDLVQEVFTEIWKKAGSFNPNVASETTYIGLIARRRAIDCLRRQGRQPGFETLDAAESIPTTDEVISSATCDPETIRSAVTTLPDETRQLFKLFFEDGFTHPEIAEKTGLPLGTVKTRLRRGLISLREHLQRQGSSQIPQTP